MMNIPDEYTTLPENYKSNNTFSERALSDSLHIIRNNSFRYLYQLQKDLSKYQRFDFDMSDLKLINSVNNTLQVNATNKYALFIDNNFIDTKDNLSFKRSEFYNKEMSCEQISQNTNIFSNNFLPFVDGKLMTNVTVKCKEDKTCLIFNVTNSDVIEDPYVVTLRYFQELREKNAKITIYFIPNSLYGVHTSNIHVIRKFASDFDFLRFRNNYEQVDTNVSTLTFISDPNNTGIASVINTEPSKNGITIENGPLTQYGDVSSFLLLVGMPNLVEKKEMLASEEYFMLDIRDMPIPTENIIVFKKEADGKETFVHDAKIKLFYPNIYKVETSDTTANLCLYIFYATDSGAKNLKYENQLYVYHRFMSDVLQEYKNGTVPDFIKNYYPEEYEYNIKQFNTSKYDPLHLKYKLAKIEEWIRYNNDVLSTYVLQLMKDRYKLFIDISKLSPEELASKIRLDNKKEILDVERQVTFDEERYLIILKKSLVSNFDIRLFIDGIFYVPDKIFDDGENVYCYIPKSMINSDTRIDIEKINQYRYVRNISFKDTEEQLRVDINNGNSKVHVNDIFFILPDENRYIDKRDIKIFLPTEDYTREEVTRVSFRDVKDTFFIQLINPELVGKKIQVSIKRESDIIEWKIETEEDKNNSFAFDKFMNNDRRHIRIFRNGKLIPLHLYRVSFNRQIGGLNKLDVNVKKEIGDVYQIDITPYKFKQVIHMDTIPPNGLIKLTGKIAKPFNLKYYDVFLNGRKINNKNIEKLTPTQILIKDVSSLKNLYILERDWDEDIIRLPFENEPEFPGTPEDPDILPFPPDVGDDIIDLPEIDDSIDNNIPDTDLPNIPDIEINLDGEMRDFMEQFLKYLDIVNPDLPQVDDICKIEYPNILDLSGNIMINPDTFTRNKDV